MEPSPGRAFALLLTIFLFAVPLVTADIGGYSVKPGPIDVLSGHAHDPVLISFWDLTLREMLIILCLSFCPVLVYPVEIFFFLKLMTVLGYRKVERNAVSYNRNRQKILDCITANPGVRFHALEQMTGMKEGTLKYHLLVLAMKSRIVSFGSGRSLRYFENNGRYSELEKKLFLHLRNPTSRRILEILATSPEVSRKDIAERVGVTGPSVTWYTKRLSGDGIITTQREGSVVRYILSPAYVSIFDRYFGKDTGVVFGSPAAGEGT